MDRRISEELIGKLIKNFKELLDEMKEDCDNVEYNSFFSYSKFDYDLVNKNFQLMSDNCLRNKSFRDLFEMLSSFSHSIKVLMPVFPGHFIPIVQLLPVDYCIYKTVIDLIYGNHSLMEKENNRITYKAFNISNQQEFQLTQSKLSNNFDYCVLLNIKNFYPGIALTKLEYILRERKCNHEYIRLLMVILEKLSQNKCNGIPIGPKASEKLAEIVLNEFDKFIVNNWSNRRIINENVEVKVLRWSDKFLIYSNDLNLLKSLTEDLYLDIIKAHNFSFEIIIQSKEDFKEKLRKESECNVNLSLSSSIFDSLSIENIIKYYLSTSNRRDLTKFFTSLSNQLQTKPDIISYSNIYNLLIEFIKCEKMNVIRTIAKFLIKNKNLFIRQEENLNEIGNNYELEIEFNSSIDLTLKKILNQLFLYFLKCSSKYEKYLLFHLFTIYEINKKHFEDNIEIIEKNELLKPDLVKIKYKTKESIRNALNENNRAREDSSLWVLIEIFKQMRTYDLTVTSIDDLNIHEEMKNVLPFIPIMNLESCVNKINLF